MRAIDTEFYVRTLATLPSDELYDLRHRSVKYPRLVGVIDTIINERRCRNQYAHMSAVGQAEIMLNSEHDSWNNPELTAVQSH